jgi:integrase
MLAPLGASMPKSLSGHFLQLIGSSLSRPTWLKYESGWKAFEKFELFSGKSFSWPLPAEAIRGFVTWCLSVSNLSPQSTRVYLAALSMAHKLKGMARPASLDDPLAMMALTGAANRVQGTVPEIKASRRAMTLPLLKILGHQLTAVKWDSINVQAYWTVSTMGFFTSARLGEFLANDEDTFDPSSTLVWDDIKWRGDGSALIHLRNTKTRQVGGEYLDLFPFTGHNVCPVQALLTHQQRQQAARLSGGQNPVFRLANGKNLTTSTLNKILKLLLSPYLEPGRDTISCHSFRAAAASALNSSPHSASEEDIKEWGRWKSSSFSAYTRLQGDRKKAIFEKLANSLNN